MSIAENLRSVRQRMDAAARAAGRDPGSVLLVGASKMNGAEACRAAIAAGIDALGENRVQEMTAKLAEHAYDGAPLHFIGHLQRNKVRQVVGRVELIHSAGSLELLAGIDRQAEKLQTIQNVLLEVNIGGEESKSGFAPEDLYAAAEQARSQSCQTVSKEVIADDGSPVDGNAVVDDVIQSAERESGQKTPARTVAHSEKDQRENRQGDGPAVGQTVQPQHSQNQGQGNHDGPFAQRFCFL